MSYEVVVGCDAGRMNSQQEQLCAEVADRYAAFRVEKNEGMFSMFIADEKLSRQKLDAVLAKESIRILSVTHMDN